MLNFWKKQLEKLNSLYDKFYVNRKYFNEHKDTDKEEYIKKQMELSNRLDEQNDNIKKEIQKCIDKAFPGTIVLCVDTRSYRMEDSFIGRALAKGIAQHSMCFEIEKWIECNLSIRVAIDRVEDLDEETLVELKKTLQDI